MENQVKLFVPGRVCLFGEHSDWAGGHRRTNPAIEKGYTLICGTQEGIYAEVEPHPTALELTATTPEGTVFGPHMIPMDPSALLKEARRAGFWSYIAGVAYQMQRKYPIQGLRIHNYRTDLPIQKGLSSSAAICVLTARAFGQIYGLNLPISEEMELAYLGEITTPSQCGRMDQGCAFGNSAVLMTFDGDDLATEKLNVGGKFHFVLVDLLAEKDTVRILADLNSSYPQASSDVQKGVQRLLGTMNRTVVLQAIEALQAGDSQRLGELMDEAQAQFDQKATPACPSELTAPVLHHVLAYEPLRAHVWGGKGVGSQGDGSAQFMARSKRDQEAVVEIVQRDLGMPCLKLTLSPH